MPDRTTPHRSTRWRNRHARRWRLPLETASASPWPCREEEWSRRLLRSAAVLAISLLPLTTLAHSWAQTPLALRAPQVATPLPASSDCSGGENLLSNPGFESGTESWYVNGSVAPTTAALQSGNGAMRLGAPDADAYMDRRISPVASNATYELSGWGKLSASGESAKLGVLLSDRSGHRLTTEEPAPLLFTDSAFVERRLTFTVSNRVAEMYIYLAKEAGDTQFYADSLSLTLCQPAAALAATPVATPVATTPILQQPTLVATRMAPATPIVSATSIVAVPTAAATSAPLVTYVDPDFDLTVGYPTGWRRLSEEEIRAQLGPVSDAEADAALGSTRMVVVSPDGQAALSLTVLPHSGGASLADIAHMVQEADAASMPGVGEIATDAVTLDGSEAIRLNFSADDPATGAAGGRVIRQWVALDDDATIVLAFVTRRDAAAAYEETVQRIEASWRWGSEP